MAGDIGSVPVQLGAQVGLKNGHTDDQSRQSYLSGKEFKCGKRDGGPSYAAGVSTSK